MSSIDLESKVEYDKKYIALLSPVVLLVIAIPAFAAASDTGFSDVEADAWYADALMQYDCSRQAVPNTGSKVLVAYFSRYGNISYDSNVDATTSASVVVSDGQQQGTAELIARMIADETVGDLHLIETTNVYPTDFNEVVDQNHQEISNGTRPALTSNVDVSGY